MMRIVTVMSILCLVSTALWAQQMNEPDSPCAGPGTTVDLVACLTKARAASDRTLDSVYDEISKKLDASEGKQLAEAQQLWVKYREANCSAERSLYGLGTGAYPAYLACIEAMARERTRDLRITYRARMKW